MGTGRKLNKKPMTRPKKKPGDRRRRERTQKKRLLALGAAESAVAKMNPKQIRTLLRRPARVAPKA
jgi:hypothetical protein